jgi:hypothetical protein
MEAVGEQGELVPLLAICRSCSDLFRRFFVLPRKKIAILTTTTFRITGVYRIA